MSSWLMILSGTVCGHIADRTGRRNLVLSICMAGAIAALALLSIKGGGLTASLIFGLIGMAPAGVIMALAGVAMRPERRAIGMGVFFTVYYAIMALIPPVSGWIFDRTGTACDPLLFGALLFAAVVPAAILFRHIQSRPVSVTGPSAVPVK